MIAIRMPGISAVDAEYRRSVPAAVKHRSDADAGVVGCFVRRGVSSTSTFRDTEVSDAELADLVALTRLRRARFRGLAHE